MLLTRAYHERRGERRTKVLTPDTAHGTNPATVTMAGYEVVKVGTDARGGVDLDDLRAEGRLRRRLPDADQPEHARPLRPQHRGDRADRPRRRRRSLYYDGANLNAVMGISRPGDMGFDIVHFNLHKSFTQPHGGGGPGVRPDRGRPSAIEPFLPRPVIVRHGGAGGQRLKRRVRPRLRPPAVDRAPARLPGQLRLLRALLRLHLLARRRRPARRLRDRGAERQLPARAAARARRLRAAAARLRSPLHARVRAQRRADEAASSGSARSTSPSACSTTATTRRPSTSRCWSRRRC